MSALLEALDVTKVFSSGVSRRSETVALRHFSLRIDAGQPSITGVVGESGSGKSTMARLLLGLETPSAGSIRFDGEDIRKLPRERRQAFRRNVQAIFQDPFESFNSLYKVDHMLEVPLQKFRLATDRHDRRQRMEEALMAVGLRPEETLGRYPHQLSGGQRQRIMVARALMLDPKLIVADEPVSMVDASLRATILTSLRRLTDEMGISIIYITHDLATAYQVSDSILVMYRACVAEAGAVERVVKHPQHPYTQLLISSIPQVSTTRDWLAEEGDHPPAATPSAHGCRFVDRCPVAMAKCATALPPLFRTEPARAAACFRHEAHPELAAGALNEVLRD